MNKVEEKILLIELYDYYQELLTQKQRSYFEASYFDDSSIGEIAEEYSISRNAVHDQLKKTIAKLKDYEVALKLRENNRKLNTLLNTIKESDSIDRIKSLIDEFEKEE